MSLIKSYLHTKMTENMEFVDFLKSKGFVQECDEELTRDVLLGEYEGGYVPPVCERVYLTDDGWMYEKAIQYVENGEIHHYEGNGGCIVETLLPIF